MDKRALERALYYRDAGRDAPPGRLYEIAFIQFRIFTRFITLSTEDQPSIKTKISFVIMLDSNRSKS